MCDSEALRARVRSVRHRIAEACRSAGRAPADVRLLAVSKTRSAAEIRAAATAGLTRFGENHLDEAGAKQAELAGLALEWHFIGPIQSNKTRAIAASFDWVQSVDRTRIVRRLGEQRDPEAAPLNVLLQVNIDREPQKSGCPPEKIAELADAVGRYPSLMLRGLMAIPAADNDDAQNRAAFGRMRGHFKQLRHDHPAVDTLSMGMSADLEIAIEQGSTMVRVGTALFGPR
ncbi:MAG: YggS family pyridoxal phosphate-dependent enzyme [Wenzhouxiangellaceae bacterium]|nr:YggS family pyridoxal phosphate-dependent enzyme [Wenzhouxiangellaceae bacterium]